MTQCPDEPGVAVNPAGSGCEYGGVRHRIAGLLLLAVATATACSGAGAASSKTAVSQQPLHGASANVVQPRPEFSLVDTSGRPYDFQKMTHGQVTLLYFGYTHCPDECPTAMADIAQALREVPTAVAGEVRVVFATTDPWRDSRPVLRAWLDKFHPPAAYVGLTGTPAQIAGAEVTMGMPISRRESAPKGYGSGKYSVSHFAGVLVYGRDDRLKTLYPSGVTPADIATDLKVLVKG
jgi:protein SCO1/2